MSVNSFENYVMTWKPDKESLKSPIYVSLVNQLEQDILEGRLVSGTKLPPQRELADFLELSLSTITKVYALGEKKGLLYGITGSGTFVSETADGKKSVITDNREGKNIQLGSAFSFYEQNDMVIKAAQKVINHKDAKNLLVYTNPLGSERQRKAGVKWLQLFGVAADIPNTFIANGTQNALNIILNALFEAGDRIVVDQYTYPNFIGLANMLQICLVPVNADQSGMCADELEKLCKNSVIKGIFLSSTCSNPQAINMTIERRKRIAEIIKKYEVILIEDETYAFLCEERRKPITTMLEKNAVYLNGLGKSISAGLRVAYIYVKLTNPKRVENALYNCNLIVSPLEAEIAAELIEQDMHLDIINGKRNLTNRRNMIYSDYFQGTRMDSYFQWLPLPLGISGKAFENLAKQEKVQVLGSERFLVGDSRGNYFIRIATCSPKDEQELHKGLFLILKLVSAFSNENYNDLQII